MLGAAATMGLAQGPAGRLAVQVGLAAAALDVLHEAVVAAGPGAAQGLAMGPAGPALHLAVGAVAPTLHVPLQRPVVQLPHTKQTQRVRAELQFCTAAPTLAGWYRFPAPLKHPLAQHFWGVIRQQPLQRSEIPPGYHSH